MSNKEAIRILKAHQSYNAGLSAKQYSEKRLTEALNVAISLLEGDLIYCECQRPLPNPVGPVYYCLNCDKQMK